MLIWAENHEFIQTHNQKYPKPSYTVAHNNFSDMTNDEFQKRHSLGKYSPGVDVILTAHIQAKEEAAMRKINGLANEHPLQAEFRYLRDLALPKTRKLTEDGGLTGFFDDKWWNDDGTDEADDDNQQTDDGPIPDDNDTNGLPDEVDWVKAGAVTPAKNQGACGSCWAFSTTGSIEGAMFVKHGQLTPLSEQNLIDCDHTDKGCEGGMMEDAFKFDESAHGLCSETDYPYIAKDDEMCMTNCTKVPGSVVTDYLDIDEKDKHGLLASLALQPTSIAMQADQLSFQFYSSGVFSEEDCGETGAIDHGVLAVGYGTDEETGKKYFTVKNSWGPDWGENGFFRLARQSKNEWGTCAILRVMTAPIVA
jgi:C1A family cysteine protease